MKTNKEIKETREYGAPELKKNYLKNFRKGLEIAVIIHVVIVSSCLLVTYINKVNADDNVNTKFNITYVNIPIDAPPPADDNNIEVPKTDDIVKPVKDLSALQPEPVAKNIAEEMTVKTQDELNKIIGQTSREGDSVRYIAIDNGNVNMNINNKIDDKINKIDKDDNQNKNYQSFEVEKAPECVNLAMVKSSMVFPSLAVEIGLEGRVTIKVLVGTNGQVVKTGTMTGPDIFYDEVRVKAKDLEFTPGLQNGKPVNVWVTVPFSFKLKN